MLDVPFRSATQLAADIRKKKIGCLELLELYLARVEKYDPALNAIVVRDLDRARQRARAADRAVAKGHLWGPLHGVPMTIKESYDVAGLPTTWGLPALKENIATKNAVAVDRLLAAGVVLFGKTNVPLYLADWHSLVRRCPGRSPRSTSTWSALWREAPTISSRPCRSWPGPTRSMPAAGSSACARRARNACATSRSR
jgi:Asp-tRNA(Asn)/Glu-tRNA(Gln) amidotransferase A subunit family amidase